MGVKTTVAVLVAGIAVAGGAGYWYGKQGGGAGAAGAVCTAGAAAGFVPLPNGPIGP